MTRNNWIERHGDPKTETDVDRQQREAKRDEVRPVIDRRSLTMPSVRLPARMPGFVIIPPAVRVEV